VSEYRKGWRHGFCTAWFVLTAASALLCVLTSCATPQIHIQDPVSMQMWTDHPDEPDPLEACQRHVGETNEGYCVVLSVRALAWWQVRWTACELELDDCREAKGNE
jgi:hypothetical protein